MLVVIMISNTYMFVVIFQINNTGFHFIDAWFYNDSNYMKNNHFQQNILGSKWCICISMFIIRINIIGDLNCLTSVLDQFCIKIINVMMYYNN